MNEHLGRSAGPRLAGGATILVGGLLAGTLDLAWAAGQALAEGRQPGRMLQAIASGVLGRAAFEGGGAAMALGAALHFSIALGACAAYFLLSSRWPEWHRRSLVAGATFGIAVYLFMQLVVLPLSRVPWKIAFTPVGVTLGLAAHILCIGLPISWAARRAFNRT
ncbi:MAG: hypothetical protein ABIV06_06210 [Thermoanaerobaculia bacterium]